jgi:hypothetical protein
MPPTGSGDVFGRGALWRFQSVAVAFQIQPLARQAEQAAASSIRPPHTRSANWIMVRSRCCTAAGTG